MLRQKQHRFPGAQPLQAVLQVLHPFHPGTRQQQLGNEILEEVPPLHDGGLEDVFRRDDAVPARNVTGLQLPDEFRRPAQQLFPGKQGLPRGERPLLHQPPD